MRSANYGDKCLICEICYEDVDELYRCRICGRLVCANEYYFGERICEACKNTLCEICGKYLSIGVCRNCGRLICDVCSIKENASIICKICLSNKV